MKKAVLICLSLASHLASAAPHAIKCQTTQWPVGIGSSLTFTTDQNGYPTGEAEIELNDPNPKYPKLKTTGYFHVLEPTYNEDGSGVSYLKWSAGAGNGDEGSNNLKLIPYSIAIHDFKQSYNYNKTASVGIIEWKLGTTKMESYFTFYCDSNTSLQGDRS